MSNINTMSRKGPVFDPGLCRCCGGLKKCRLLNVEYEWSGQKEVYSDMFVDCFGLLLSHLDGEAMDRLICATCVTRLREACSFRKQVLCCEQKLLQTQIHIHGETEEKINTDAFVKVEMNDVNPEPIEDSVMDDVADHIDNDGDSVKSEPQTKPKKLTKLKKKKEKKGTKRKSKKSLQNGEEQLAREDVLQKIAKMSEKLRKMAEINGPQPKPKRTVDNDHKTFHNTVAIVENSYVCPFDTSFSDYYCVYCREVFTDPCRLREHTSTHDPTTFKTSVPNKKLPQLDIHRVDCRLCSAPIDNIENLKEHLSGSHGVQLYPINNEFLTFKLTVNNLTCLECEATFSFFHALRKHMAEHFGTCICDICGAHYFEERMLMLHQRSHQRVEENYPCKECGKSFKSKHSRYLHIARMHKKEPAYQCNKCDEILFSYSLRYRHMIEVHGEQRMYPCEHCDRAYDSRKSLREHNRRFHLKIFKHQCDLCEKRFYLPSRLKEHIATHTGERNFRCEYCGKSYPRLRGLKVHMQSHSSEKKYKCMMCNASFTQNVNLKNHMKRQHQSLDAEEGYHEGA